MNCSDLSDQELVDTYAKLAAESDPASDDFPVDDASCLAAELEQRGFIEAQGVWSHPDKAELAWDGD